MSSTSDDVVDLLLGEHPVLQDLVLGVVQLDLERGQDVQQTGADGTHGLPELSGQAVHRLLLAFDASGAYDLLDGLCLREVHSSVHKGAEGELAPESRSEAQLDESGGQPPEDHEGAVGGDLDGLLPCIAMAFAIDRQHDLVDRGTVLVEDMPMHERAVSCPDKTAGWAEGSGKHPYAAFAACAHHGQRAWRIGRRQGVYRFVYAVVLHMLHKDIVKKDGWQ